MHNNCNNRETVIISQTIIVPTNSIIVASLITHGSNKLGYRRIKLHQHVLAVNKKSMINHTLAVVVFMCAEKRGRHKSLR